MAFSYIDNSEDLTKCVAKLSGQTDISVDLEFDKNRFRYGFNLCLMQIYDGQTCYLIDPLAENMNISLVFPVLENTGIQKTVFSFGEDIRLLHHIGCIPKNLFDVSTVASLLNYPPASLTNILAEVIEVETGKSSQQSNWFKRPLSEDQLRYAVEDVIHLPELKAKLLSMAKKKGLLEWITQENQYFESANYEDVDHNSFLKEKDKEDMTKFEWHLFSRLMEFREEKARAMNRPGYHLADKKLLGEIARNPKKISKWAREKGIHKKLKTPELVKEVERALNGAIKEAGDLKLSESQKAAKSFTKEEYLEFKKQQKRLKKYKKEVFQPLQHAIEKDYGKEAQIFILNNRTIRDVVQGDTESLLPYKKKLFEEYAEKLDIQVSDFW